jgi:hypothetical protein
MLLPDMMTVDHHLFIPRKARVVVGKIVMTVLRGYARMRRNLILYPSIVLILLFMRSR